MQNKINLYAIYGVAHDWDDEPFDESKLPAPIIPTVTIENVTSMFRPDTFRVFEPGLSEDDLRSLKAVKYAIVHRLRTTGYHDAETEKLESGQLVYKISACLRLIRPMRQFAMRIHGALKDDGTLDVGGFDHPVNLMGGAVHSKGF